MVYASTLLSLTENTFRIICTFPRFQAYFPGTLKFSRTFLTAFKRFSGFFSLRRLAPRCFHLLLSPYMFLKCLAQTSLIPTGQPLNGVIVQAVALVSFTSLYSATSSVFPGRPSSFIICLLISSKYGLSRTLE